MDRRRFSLLDAIAMIAATAVGLGVTRGFFASLKFWMPLFLTTWSPFEIYLAMAGVGPPMAAWSLALFGLQLIPPRPPIRRLARTPGFAASLASVSGIALCSATMGLQRAIQSARGVWLDPSYLSMLGLPGTVGLAIASAWITVAASGGWRRRRGRDWRDRIATALGWAWLGLFTVHALVLMLVG